MNLVATVRRTLARAFGRPSPAAREPEGQFEVARSDAEWRARLAPASYAVLRRHATEAPGSSSLDREHRPGTFACAGCGLPLFDASTKFDSGTGWPSFNQPRERAIATSIDTSLFFGVRTEVHCRRCGGHLGHVFNDGPRPTGARFCMNGVALTFTSEDSPPV
jgi:peptide-methionine (R)-S-oxide reductase